MGNCLSWMSEELGLEPKHLNIEETKSFFDRDTPIGVCFLPHHKPQGDEAMFYDVMF